MSQKDRDRHNRALHAMQSGVAMEMNFDKGPSDQKHLRTGINAAMSDQEGLATLLMEKGIFTLDEYDKAVADAMEREKARYEAYLSKKLGSKVSLV